MNRSRLLSFIAVVAFASNVSLRAQKPSRLDKDDAKAWGSMVWVYGHIHLANHPTLGRTPANGEVIAFRRTDGTNHVVAVRANIEGKYEIFLDRGRYRIIVPGLNADRNGFVDTLAPKQARYLDVRKDPSGIRFDIEIVLAKTD